MLLPVVQLLIDILDLSFLFLKSILLNLLFLFNLFGLQKDICHWSVIKDVYINFRFPTPQSNHQHHTMATCLN